jgi:hypothetical protein
MIVACFRDQAKLSDALAALQGAGIAPVESYTPAPLQDAAVHSPIPFAMLLAGLLGTAASFALQSWSFIVDYPFDIGGRPHFAWPSFIPNAFENGVLLALVTGFAGFLLVNGLPLLHDPVDEADSMRGASADAWVLAVCSDDPSVRARARALLHGLRPDHIEELAP